MPQITKIKRGQDYTTIYTAAILTRAEEQAVKQALISEYSRTQTGQIFFRVQEARI